MPDLAPKEICTGCSACYSVCPVQAIRMLPDSEGFLQPNVDASLCMECGRCVRTCPVLKPLSSMRSPLAVYAAINKDESIRRRSSSGGVFHALAEIILREGGVVFGAGWDGKVVCHKQVDTLDGLGEVLGSKYVQSEIRDSYLQVRDLLKSGRDVLFSGTPCQIAGLQASLGHKYNNLFCLDLICHAVPSPRSFASYMDEIERSLNAQIEQVQFRDKREGWKRFSIAIDTHGGGGYTCSLQKDPFLRGFLVELYNRPSCSECRFRELRSGADLTLGDFWSVSTLLQGFDDDRGTSVLFVVSEKGGELWKLVQRDFIWKEVAYSDVVERNPALVSSRPLHRKRTFFFSKLDRMRFSKLVSRCLAPSWPSWIKMQGKRVLRKGIRIVRRAFGIRAINRQEIE